MQIHYTTKSRFFNEIAQGAMKSSLCSDEICFADEIKSTHPPSRRISSLQGEFIIEDDLSHPIGWI
jgi:hypothetical protein